MCCRWLYKPKLCGFCVACSTSTGITGPQVVAQANVRSTLFHLYPDQVLLQSGLLLGPVPFFITFVPHHEFPFRTLEDYSIHKHLYFWSFTKLWMLFSITQNGELTLRKYGDSKLLITKALKSTRTSSRSSSLSLPTTASGPSDTSYWSQALTDESEVLCQRMERKQLLHPSQFTLFKRWPIEVIKIKLRESNIW